MFAERLVGKPVAAATSLRDCLAVLLQSWHDGSPSGISEGVAAIATLLLPR